MKNNNNEHVRQKEEEEEEEETGGSRKRNKKKKKVVGHSEDLIVFNKGNIFKPNPYLLLENPVRYTIKQNGET